MIFSSKHRETAKLEPQKVDGKKFQSRPCLAVFSISKHENLHRDSSYNCKELNKKLSFFNEIGLHLKKLTFLDRSLWFQRTFP